MEILFHMLFIFDCHWTNSTVRVILCIRRVFGIAGMSAFILGLVARDVAGYNVECSAQWL